MAADLTRDDLARLRELRAANIAADEAYFASDTRSGPLCLAAISAEDAFEAAWEALFDDLLAAAERDLDRREGLVFGPPVGESHLRCAVSVDGHLYQIRDDATGEDEPCEDIVEWMHVKSGDGDTNVVGVEKAIKQARAHDVARRGGR